MKILRIFLALTALGLIIGAASAQTNPQTQITWPRVTGSGAPTSTCPSTTNTTTTATLGTPYTDLTNSNQYVCMSSGWAQINGSGSFAAGGDLSGSSSVQQVVGLKNVKFCTGFTPTNGQFIELTTGGSPNPCYTAATPGGGGNAIYVSNSGDIGASINAADATLGATPGEIVVANGGGTITTVAALSCGHVLTFGAGTYNGRVVVCDSTTGYVIGDVVRGAGADQTTLHGTDATKPVISSPNFATLTGTTNAYGATATGIYNITISGGSINIQLYGRRTRTQNVVTQSAVGDCIYLESHDASSFTIPADDDQTVIAHAKSINCGADGLDIGGTGTQGIVATDYATWGMTGWGIESSGSFTLQGYNTYLGSSGGVHLKNGANMLASDSAFTNAAGFGLKQESGAGETLITSSVFACSGCVAISLGGVANNISGQVINSGQGLVFAGGGGNLSLNFQVNTTDVVCTSMDGRTLGTFDFAGGSTNTLDSASCGNAGNNYTGLLGDITAAGTTTFHRFAGLVTYVAGFAYTYPNVNGTFALTTTQTFAGTQTFSGAINPSYLSNSTTPLCYFGSTITNVGCAAGGSGFPITIGSTSVAASSTTTTIAGLTLTAPVIATIVNTGTLTLPTSTDTLVGRATTDTLTNKTLTSPALTGTVTGANTIPLPILQQAAANTMVGNWTSGTANEVANAMPSCTGATNALGYTSGTGVICNGSINAATLGGATFAAPGAIGGTTPNTGAFTLITATQSNGIFSMGPSLIGKTNLAATSGGNFGSPFEDLDGSIWNGTTAVDDVWRKAVVVGSGSNPTSTLTYTHPSGTSGTAAVSFPALVSTVINATNNTISNITGAMMTNNTVTAAQLAAQYSKGSCTEAWGGSGTSHALSSGDDAVVNNTCYNDSGVTRTITAVKCRNDNASNTTTVNPTFGSAGTGTTILSGALTCGNSYAYSSTGTVSNASWTTGTGINPVQGGTLTGTSIALIVEYTY